VIFAFSCISHFRVFACFAFSRVLHFCASRIFHTFHVSDSSHFHTSHILRAFRDPTQFVFCALAYLAGFAFRVFTFSHVLSSSSKVHWCIFHFVSLALHHICLHIPIYVHLSRYVFILHHPCMFSATYSAPSPGNSLSMLTCQRIVGGFYFTSLPSLRH
jgi:hypothetical protein